MLGHPPLSWTSTLRLRQIDTSALLVRPYVQKPVTRKSKEHPVQYHKGDVAQVNVAGSIPPEATRRLKDVRFDKDFSQAVGMSTVYVSCPDSEDRRPY